MPIAVVCPGCKARFSVSEKFAGKQGPCPKCRQIITIPAAAAEEVKIHAPEDAPVGASTMSSRAGGISKPVRFREGRFNPLLAAAAGGGTLAAFAGAWFLRGMNSQWPIAAAGLLLLSPLVACGGYLLLRNRELDAYRGGSLWIRSALCGLAYAALWGVYWPLAQYGVITGESWQLLLLLLVLCAVGGGAAFSAFDFDFGTGVVHYGFYLLTTLALRAAFGLPPLWAGAST